MVEDDEITTDSNTVSTKAVLTADGFCSIHRNIRMRGRDANGHVFQRDSCPECDSEFAQNRRNLQEKQRQLDLKLQALENDPTEHSRASTTANGTSTPAPPPAPTPAQPATTPAPGGGPLATAPAPSPYGMYSPYGNPYGQPPPPHMHPYGQYPPPPQPTDSSGAPQPGPAPSMYGYPYGMPPPPMQTLQPQQSDESSKYMVTLLQQREDELNKLRQRNDQLNQQLQEQNVQLAVLKSEYQVAQSSREQERKLMQLQAESDAHAKVQEMQTKWQQQHDGQLAKFQQQHEEQVRTLTMQHQQALDHLEQRYQRQAAAPVAATAPAATTPAATNPTPTPEPKAAMPVAPPDEADDEEPNPPPAATPTLDKAKKIPDYPKLQNAATAVTATHQPDEARSNSPTPESISSSTATEGTANKEVPASSVKEMTRRMNQANQPAPSATPKKNHPWNAAATTNDKEDLRGDDSLWNSELVTQDLPNTTPAANDLISESDESERQDEFDVNPSNRFTPKIVPPANLDDDDDVSQLQGDPVDERSLGQTVASSTYGEDRHKVKDQSLLDPYGDKGIYTGVVLRSTGMPHGLGRMTYEEDGRVYEGDWRHGRWHGFGRANFSNGDSYEGEYKFDQRHGRGIYRWHDGRVYDGSFAEDKRHGKGVFTWPDGAVYDGDFVNGQREGHGRYTFADGGQYDGSWSDGRYNGYGACTWEDGRKYEGEWRNGMAHGYGTETYPNGNVRHEGQWIDDEPVRK